MFADDVWKAERDRAEAELMARIWRKPSLWRRIKQAWRRAFRDDPPSYDEQDPLYLARDGLER